MQRMGMTIRLKAGCAAAYKQHHKAVWPEVLRMITECNLRNYSIYFKDDVLFSYFEYHGTDLQADMARMAADPRTQEWWAVVMPLQEPVSARATGEWWADMEELFHLD